MHGGDQRLLAGGKISCGSIVQQGADPVNILNSNNVRKSQLGEGSDLGILGINQ